MVKKGKFGIYGVAALNNVFKFNLRSVEFARYEKHGNKCSFSFPSDLRKIFTLRKHFLMLLEMKRRFLFM